MRKIFIKIKYDMEILKTTGIASVKTFVEKSIGSIVFYCDKVFDDLNDEQIRIFVERNGHNNIEITKGLVNLKKFILCATYGDDAITSFRPAVCDAFETVAIIELCELGAIKLDSNDKIKIEFSNLDTTKTYIVDGIEEPVLSKEIFTYEEKILSSESKTVDIKTKNYDILVIDDSDSISEIQYHYDNGVTCNYTKRELRALSQDKDPIAYVRKNGSVMCSFVGVLQLPLKGVDNITIKKNSNTTVSLLMRHDVDLNLFNN